MQTDERYNLETVPNPSDRSYLPSPEQDAALISNLGLPPSRQKGEVVDLVYRALQTNVRINGSSTVGTLPHFVPDPSSTETLRYLNGSKPGAGNAEKGARAYDFS